MNVLEDMSSGQVNLESEGARKNIANTIIAAIKSNGGKYGKGWFLDLSTLDGEPKLDTCAHGNSFGSNCSECDEEQARETWVCTICGKSTYNVDSDYIGTKTNHIGCELEMENADEDAREPNGDEIAKALGHMDTDGNYITEDMPEGLRRAKELSQEAIEEGMRRTKSEMQLEHEDKVFDTAGEEVEPVNSYFTADVKDKRDLEDQKIGGDTGIDADFRMEQSEDVD